MRLLCVVVSGFGGDNIGTRTFSTYELSMALNNIVVILAPRVIISGNILYSNSILLLVVACAFDPEMVGTPQSYRVSHPSAMDYLRRRRLPFGDV